MNIQGSCRRVLFLAALCAGAAAANGTSTSEPEPGDLRAAGKIEFPISGAAGVRPEFERGVALLHSFFYEEARRIFAGVAEKDPNCAMAQWGIAMTWWHPIWTPPTAEEMAAGRAAIDRAMEMIRLRQATFAQGYGEPGVTRVRPRITRTARMGFLIRSIEGATQ